MMQHERRVWERKPLEQLSYISLPGDNGGIILDVSEGGLAFRAVDPVVADGPIRFRFSVDSAPKIETVGEIAWKDESGKSGGLRFTEMSDELREQIRILMGQPAALLPALPDLGPAVDVTIAPPACENSPLVPATRQLSLNAKASPFDPTVSPFTMFPLKVESRARATEQVAQRVSFPTSHPVATLVLTILLSLAVASGFVTYLAVTHTGEFLIQWGEDVWNGSNPKPSLPSAAPSGGSAPNTTTTSQKQ